MNFSSPRIIFMGTPDFAVASLEALVEAGYQIVGVITAPDKPAGRGMKLTESAVKKYAVEKGFKVLQPEKLKDPQFLAALRSLKAELQLVVAFRMLPELVWNMPPMGTINLHASLLPQYRGAAPINWAVINGETETGLTTFKLKQEIDTGDILLREKLSISENESAGELHDRMKLTGAALLVRTVKELNSLQETPQTSSTGITILKTAPKIVTETCKIDWNKQANDIHNLIRGLSPYPGAFCFLHDKMLKVYLSKKEITKATHSTGEVVSDGKSFLKFACADGYIHALELQPEGKKRMPVEDFLRGYKMDKDQ